MLVSFDSSMSYNVFHGGSSSSLSVDSPAFPARRWTHVAVVQTRSTTADTTGPAKIFWDGVQRASGTLRFPQSVSRNHLSVGKSNWESDALFTGAMLDLFVWDAALSEAELETVRLAGHPPVSQSAPLVSMMRTCGRRK